MTERKIIYLDEAIDAVNELTKWYLKTYHETRPTAVAVIDRLTELSSAQPDNRLTEIADLVEGTIDHFNLEDAMDLLYQIKEVIGEEE